MISKHGLKFVLLACGAMASPSICAAQTAQTVSVDLSDARRIGTPNIFGVVPKTDWPDRAATFPLLRRYGFKFARTTALLPDILPKDITLAQYRASMATSTGLNDTGVADPATWNWGDDASGGGAERVNFSWQIPYIKDQGIAVYLTITNLPGWLSFSGAPCNLSSCRNVPADFEVYADIVAKVYDRYRDQVSWVNILNEPDRGNDLIVSGTPYAGQSGSTDGDRVNASHDMYYHAANAIRSLNPTIPIGGFDLGGATTDYMKDLHDSSFIGPASSEGEVPVANFNFYSNHPYGSAYRGHPESSKKMLAVAATIGRENNLDIFHSEYNYTFGVSSSTSPNMRGIQNMAYVATALSQMMYEEVKGAAIYTFINQAKNDADESAGEEGFWMYDFDASGKIVANQNMKAFRLASRVLGLGDGAYAVKGIATSPQVAFVTGAAAVNAGGENVLYFSNFTNAARTITPVIKNPGFGTDPATAVIESYLASQTNEGIVPISSTAVTLDPVTTTLPAISMPAYSILGLKVKRLISSSVFDGDTVGTRPPPGWDYDDAAGGYAEVATTDGGANKALRITDTSSAQKVQVKRAFTATSGRVTVTFRAQAAQLNQEAGFSILDSSNNLLTTVAFDSNGTFYAYDRTTKLGGLAPYAANSWQDIRIVLDTTLDVYDAYIGDTQVVDRQRFRTTANVTNVASVRVNTSTAGTGTYLYDNVTVTK